MKRLIAKVRSARLLVCAVAVALAGCVSVGIGSEASQQRMFVLNDPGTVTRLVQPVVPALLIQPMPSGMVADTLAIAYSRRAHELAFYQLATWHERPVRQIPRLLQQRLEARGVAGAVGLIGDPLRGDWLLTLRVDRLEHDIATVPGTAHVALTAELFDRRQPGRIARQQFNSEATVASADSAAAAQAMSRALAQNFNALLPWVEAQLAAQHASATASVSASLPAPATRPPP